MLYFVSCNDPDNVLVFAWLKCGEFVGGVHDVLDFVTWLYLFFLGRGCFGQDD